MLDLWYSSEIIWGGGGEGLFWITQQTEYGAPSSILLLPQQLHS